MIFNPLIKKKIIMEETHVGTEEIARTISVDRDIQITYIGSDIIQCKKCNHSMFIRNAFLPIVEMTNTHIGQTTVVTLSCHMHESAQVGTYILNLFVVLFQIAILLFFKGTVPIPGLIPMVIILYFRILSYVALYFQARQIVNRVTLIRGTGQGDGLREP